MGDILSNLTWPASAILCIALLTPEPLSTMGLLGLAPDLELTGVQEEKGSRSDDDENNRILHRSHSPAHTPTTSNAVPILHLKLPPLTDQSPSSAIDKSPSSTITTECDFSCDFDVDFCHWTQSTADNFDWIRHQGSTPSQMTGPPSDHTTGGKRVLMGMSRSCSKAQNAATRLFLRPGFVILF